MAECCAAAAELHEQGLISATLLERVCTSMQASEATQQAVLGAAGDRSTAVLSTSHAAALLQEGVISFPVFVRAHLLGGDRPSQGHTSSVVEASILSGLDACSLSYLRGDLESYKSATDTLGENLLRSRSSIAECSLGWFQAELTALLEGLVQYYLGSHHWDRVDDVLKANIEDAELETGAALAAGAAMSRTWSRLKRSVWDSAVTKRLASTREFNTMAEILKSVETEESSELIMARHTPQTSKSPCIVMLGGGMAAGKSTVVDKLKHEWTGYLVIEADSFKMNGTTLASQSLLERSSHRLV